MGIETLNGKRVMRFLGYAVKKEKKSNDSPKNTVKHENESYITYSDVRK